MRYLAIDHGEKRTGMAVGSDTTGIVSPIGVIVTTSDSERMRQIALAIAEHVIDEIVLGLPLNMDGSEGSAAQRVKGLKGFIEQRHGIPVRLMDERLTTFAADEQMAGKKLTRGRKKELRDALAAAAILRDFLELREKSNPTNPTDPK
ncbi:MAG: Holliday junction resolvase RuvX [Phycisphaeraceae bacterium]|nr:Holliday junction resolvase RuvX [Phycisphaeraceae bacterium]